MNKERIEQIALGVANREVMIVGCELLASEITEYATRFLAQVDAERAKEGYKLVPTTIANSAQPPDEFMRVHAEWVNDYVGYAALYAAVVATAPEIKP